jgi:hypothetical protein
MLARILALGLAIGLAGCATDGRSVQGVERDAYGRPVLR